MATTEEIRSDLAEIVNEVAGVDADDLGTEQAHAEDVERLAAHVFRAHVDAAL